MDLQFLPYNKRTKEVITPKIVQRMTVGGELTTDCWRAYIGAAEAAQVKHMTVNHSKEFKSPETGACTNNCEGIHGVIKRDAFSQFGRLPYLNDEGETYYLDLLVWRANARLQGKALFEDFCKVLWLWIHHGLEDWNRRIPLIEDQDEELVEDHDDEDGLEDLDPDDWFLSQDKVQTDDDEAEKSGQEEATEKAVEQTEETEREELVELMDAVELGLVEQQEQVL